MTFTVHVSAINDWSWRPKPTRGTRAGTPAPLAASEVWAGPNLPEASGQLLASNGRGVCGSDIATCN
jgi:hypothetical protein